MLSTIVLLSCFLVPVFLVLFVMMMPMLLFVVVMLVSMVVAVVVVSRALTTAIVNHLVVVQVPPVGGSGRVIHVPLALELSAHPAALAAVVVVVVVQNLSVIGDATVLLFLVVILFGRPTRHARRQGIVVGILEVVWLPCYLRLHSALWSERPSTAPGCRLHAASCLSCWLEAYLARRASTRLTDDDSFGFLDERAVESGRLLLRSSSVSAADALRRMCGLPFFSLWWLFAGEVTITCCS